MRYLGHFQGVFLIARTLVYNYHEYIAKVYYVSNKLEGIMIAFEY